MTRKLPIIVLILLICTIIASTINQHFIQLDHCKILVIDAVPNDPLPSRIINKLRSQGVCVVNGTIDVYRALSNYEFEVVIIRAHGLRLRDVNIFCLSTTTGLQNLWHYPNLWFNNNVGDFNDHIALCGNLLPRPRSKIIILGTCASTALLYDYSYKLTKTANYVFAPKGNITYMESVEIIKNSIDLYIKCGIRCLTAYLESHDFILLSK